MALNLVLRVGVPFLFFLSACGPVTSHYVKVDQNLIQENYGKADGLVAKNKEGYGKRNAVLYYMDRGMTLHLADKFSESNQFLEKADRRIDELYTKSVSAAAGAMLSNDNTLPYEGEDFEKVMLNLIGALNYISLGQWPEALVEARRVDHKLNVMNDRYSRKNIYKEDAFVRYLSGILYEAQGELNDAFISYRKSYEIYQDYQKDYQTPIPPILPQDLLRVTEAIGLSEEHRAYRKQFSNTQWISQKEMDRKGELIFLSLDGLSPIKEDYFIDAPIPDGKGGTYLLRVALPRFIARPTDIAYAEVHLIGSDGAVASQRTFLVEDITQIARKNLEDRIGRITAKAIARATTKYLASRTAKREATKAGGDVAGELIGFLTNVYSVATEQADKRSWRTLPGQFRMARLSAPEGSYTVAVEYYTFGQRMILRKTYEVHLRSGEKKFLGHRILGSPTTLKSRRSKK